MRRRVLGRMVLLQGLRVIVRRIVGEVLVDENSAQGGVIAVINL